MSILRPTRHPVSVLPRLPNGALPLRLAQLPRLRPRLARSQTGTAASMICNHSHRFRQPTVLSLAMPSALLVRLPKPALARSLVGPSPIPASVYPLVPPRWVALVPIQRAIPCLSWETDQLLVMNVPSAVASVEVDLFPLHPAALPLPLPLVPTAARLAAARFPLLLRTTVLSLLPLRFAPFGTSVPLPPDRLTPTNSTTTALAPLLRLAIPPVSLRVLLLPLRRLRLLRSLLVSAVMTVPSLR